MNGLPSFPSCSPEASPTIITPERPDPVIFVKYPGLGLVERGHPEQLRGRRLGRKVGRIRSPPLVVLVVCNFRVGIVSKDCHLTVISITLVENVLAALKNRIKVKESLLFW